MNKKLSVKDITTVSLLTALLCISSYIAFVLPFTTVKFTAQTIVINITAMILKPKHSVLAMVIYISLGIVGIPVFPGGNSGVGYLFSAVGGFYIGFLVAAVIMSVIKGDKLSYLRYVIVMIVVGMPIIYLFGTIQMSYILKKDFYDTLKVAVFPFIPWDVAKCFLSAFIAIRVNKYLKYKRS
ncbi:biotin transporter BioY [Clostridium cellulovorans]|uniref:Biotin transporter n=1 Tax=Clostridium cellulovorans (strain ATCC 35296 / DSM 3052 / OCM 3 / 743B) TaxID=573061 RepID=D9SUT7_CLOC7|nr:biotin transporter BioY [Clostridium cellulovorans]ADL50992.1 BioY protein [Clostridium cellulovorans 743B]